MVEQKYASIDAYIDTFPAEVRPVLEQVRSTILDAVPGTGEAISYHMPTIVLDGQPLVHFAGWKHHVSMYPAPSGDADYERRIAPYRSGASTLKFPLGHPLPFDLIAQVATLLAAQREDAS